MRCAVYRSNKKAGVYVYLALDKEWSDLPDELTRSLGECVLSMHLDLSKRSKLASEDINTVKRNLREQGFHLQLPPKITAGVISYR